MTARLAFGYAAVVAVLALLALALARAYALVLVTVPLLALAVVAVSAGMVAVLAPRAGSAVVALLFGAVASLFAAAEVAYDPDGRPRPGLVHDLGSALDNHVFPHAATAVAGAHAALAVAAVAGGVVDRRARRASAARR